MNRGSKIAIAALVTIVVVFAALAWTGMGKSTGPDRSITGFFQEYSDQDWEGAMTYTIVATMNGTAQSSYVMYLEAQSQDQTVHINSLSDQTSILSDEVKAAVDSGMATLSEGLGKGIMGWRAYHVNVTETFESWSTQKTSDFYVLVVQINDAWYLEPTSFQDDPANWIGAYA